MHASRFQRAVKALLLISTGLFLYSRFANGTLYFYINERFAWMSVLAFFGFLLVGISYRWAGDAHAHPDHGHDHSHGLSWGGALVVALPIVLGLLVPPQPLGASALATREMSVGGVDSVMPAAVRQAEPKAAADRNLLDWVMAFRGANDSGERFEGVDASVVGFVYRDEGDDEATFWATRYVVGCCVADATPVGVLVRWPQATGLVDGTWVRVSGRFAEEAAQPAPVLIATEVTEVPAPSQPYLYP